MTATMAYQRKKRVSFSECITIGETHGSAEYDRTSLMVEPLTAQDIVEVKQLIYAMRQANKREREDRVCKTSKSFVNVKGAPETKALEQHDTIQSRKSSGDKKLHKRPPLDKIMGSDNIGGLKKAYTRFELKNVSNAMDGADLPSSSPTAQTRQHRAEPSMKRSTPHYSKDNRRVGSMNLGTKSTPSQVSVPNQQFMQPPMVSAAQMYSMMQSYPQFFNQAMAHQFSQQSLPFMQYAEQLDQCRQQQLQQLAMPQQSQPPVYFMQIPYPPYFLPLESWC